MSHVVFISLFLGLVSGVQTVELRVDADVRTVRLQLDGREVARLRWAPWVAQVDLGDELVPAHLTAIAYDAHDHEIDRATLAVNVNRIAADVGIVLRNENRDVELVGAHRLYKQPKRARLSVDAKAVPLDAQFRAHLPDLDPSRPHFLSAEMRFEDGFVARREVAIPGGLSALVSTEITPLLVMVLGGAASQDVENCFSVDGRPLRATAVEKSDALVVMVKEPDSRSVTERLRRAIAPEVGVAPPPRSRNLQAPADRWWEPQHHEPRFDGDTLERIVWPTPEGFTAAGKGSTTSFPSSADYQASRNGIYWLLTRGTSPASEPYAVADAVAVAGVGAPGSHRRAVVLLIGTAPDHSHYSPAAVRRYLRRLGVPLFVWSIDGTRSDAADSWGPVEDISTLPKLLRAFGRVKQALDEQRVIWVATDPITALDVQADERCGYRPLAEPVKLHN